MPNTTEYRRKNKATLLANNRKWYAKQKETLSDSYIIAQISHKIPKSVLRRRKDIVDFYRQQLIEKVDAQRTER